MVLCYRSESAPEVWGLVRLRVLVASAKVEVVVVWSRHVLKTYRELVTIVEVLLLLYIELPVHSYEALFPLLLPRKM